MFSRYYKKLVFCSQVGLSVAFGSPSLDVNVGPHHSGGFGGNAAARYWVEMKTAIQVSVGVQGIEASTHRSRAFARAVMPVLVGMRYQINRGSNDIIQPHLNVGMGPYFAFTSEARTRGDATAGTFVNWGIRPGTGFDLNLSEELYTAVNVGYHFVKQYEGLETTLGLGYFF